MDRPFSEHWTCINHEKEAIGNEKTQKINCHVEKIVEKVLIYYLRRTDTIVQNLTIKVSDRLQTTKNSNIFRREKFGFQARSLL